MNAQTVKAHLAERGKLVEEHLRGCVADPGTPERLREAMLYSLLAGGKRLRPVLCLTTASLFGAAPKDVLPFACGIEMVHTYSLIHDDLPAMDDDDLRRGRPSNHKAFDEATAILAGDALQSDAFLCMTSCPLPADRILRAVHEFAAAAGSFGMAGGQELDMIATGRRISLEDLRHLHALKTGAILRALRSWAFSGPSSAWPSRLPMTSSTWFPTRPRWASLPARMKKKTRIRIPPWWVWTGAAPWPGSMLTAP